MHWPDKQSFVRPRPEFHAKMRGRKATSAGMTARVCMAGFSAILCMGCGMSQTRLQEAMDSHAIELGERVRRLEEALDAREEQIDALLMELADQEEQIHRAAQYIDEQAERFARAVEAVRGPPVPDLPELKSGADLPLRQAMRLRTEEPASESIEVFDVVAYRSAFFADKYGNILLTPALRLSLRNRTNEPIRLHIQARRVGLHDPFGVHVIDLQPGTRSLPLRIPYDPGHELMVRVDRQTIRYRLVAE